MPQSRRRSAVVRVVTLIIAAGLALSTTPSSAGSSDGSATEDELAAAARFRETSGFRSDAAYVARAATDVEGFPDHEFGLPLTIAEATEVRRRIGVQQRLGPARDYAAGQPGFAGSFIDQRDGGLPVFLFVGDIEGRRAAIARLLPETAFEVRPAQRTVADLGAVKGRLAAEWDEVVGDGVALLSVGFHDPSNSVLVGVARDTPEVRARLAERYGDAVTVRADGPVVRDACTSPSNCPPAKAGIRVHQSSGAFCTAGFVAKWLGSSTLTIRVLTAGHCIELNTGSWYHNGTLLGAGGNEWWFNHTDSDVGTIVESPSGAKNLPYASGPTDIRSITSVQAVANQDVGDYLCRSGAKTGYRCGNISRTDILSWSEGLFIDHSWETAYDGSPGDSGAPFYLNFGAWGQHMDSTDDDYTGPKWSWYTPVYWMQAQSSFAVCVTATCN